MNLAIEVECLDAPISDEKAKALYLSIPVNRPLAIDGGFDGQKCSLCEVYRFSHHPSSGLNIIP